MKNKMLLEKIKEKAKQDQKKRRDPRFLNAMAFLVAKGFLKTNLEIPSLPNLKLSVDDMIWAGENGEPRILEVLPAAVLRLSKHFDLDPQKHPQLATIVDQLRRRELEGLSFHGIEYQKLRVWAEFSLRDKRVKTISEKKVSKTFRLNPKVIKKLKEKASQENCTETDLLERMIMRASS